jgi:hypothetical protein
MTCEHPETRWLWSEPKEAQDAFEQWVADNRYPPEDIEDTEKREEFYENHNILICCICGEERSVDE